MAGMPSSAVSPRVNSRFHVSNPPGTRQVGRHGDVQPAPAVTIQAQFPQDLDVVAVVPLELPVGAAILGFEEDAGALPEIVVLEKVDNGVGAAAAAKPAAQERKGFVAEWSHNVRGPSRPVSLRLRRGETGRGNFG